jgi:eukaryotic-like serine/threonine-protein kinase
VDISSVAASASAGESAALAPRVRLLQRASIAWSIAALLLVAVVLGVIDNRRNARVEAPVFRAVIPNPDNAIIGAPAYLAATQGLWVALSPDAGHLAFIASDATGSWRLWVRALAGGAAHPLAGTEGGARPFWSADGRSLGFFANNKVKRVDIDGGPVLTICDDARRVGGSTA